MKPKNKTRISVKEFVAQTQDTNQTQTADPNSTTGGVPLVWGGYDYPHCGRCPHCGHEPWQWPWQQWPYTPLQKWTYPWQPCQYTGTCNGSTASIKN